MSKIDDSVLARYKVNENNFEIYVDPFLAWDFKHGKTDINFDDLFSYEMVYTDAKKGNEASRESLMDAFGTDNFQDIAKEIILKGDVQITTVQKQQMIENREKEIINYISTNAHDPKTKTPIPTQRIINSFKELKIKINLAKTKEKEIEEIINKLQKIIPISLEKVVLLVEIPASYAAKASSVIYKYDLIDQKWLPNGSLFAKIKIPSGLKAQLISDINNLTHGNARITSELEN